jgi:hypothetical protein
VTGTSAPKLPMSFPPKSADEFTVFLKTYIARWAGRAGVLKQLKVVIRWLSLPSDQQPHLAISA